MFTMVFVCLFVCLLFVNLIHFAYFFFFHYIKALF